MVLPNVQKRWTTKQERAAFLFLLPSFVTLILFVFWPILDSFLLSFHFWSLMDTVHPFIGLDNYQALFADERFWNSVYNTVYFTLISVPLCIMISLGLALLVNEPLKGTSFFKAIFFLPVITSFAIISIIWGFLMDPDIGLL
ncbi:MAG TPA: sugar ABC transporter permease, partial [Bacilli bacterium]